MRLLLLSFVLLIGCVIPAERLHGNVEIENALVKRVTDEEARAIALSSGGDDSKLEKFFLLRRPDDELWTYRTFVTADLRGGQSGLALIRRGKTAAHLPLLTYD
jgi:hypothetical protein